MRGTYTGRGVLAAAALVVTAAALSLGTPTHAGVETVADGDAVRSVWSTLDRTWNERDAERFSALFTDDVSFVFVDSGEGFESRDALHQSFAGRFPNFAPELRHVTTIRDIRGISPELFAVDGNVDILRLGTGDDAEHATLMSFAIFAVMQRQAEQWSISMLRIYRLPTAGDAAEPAGAP